MNITNSRTRRSSQIALLQEIRDLMHDVSLEALPFAATAEDLHEMVLTIDRKVEELRR